jgi:hypothetical protein
MQWNGTFRGSVNFPFTPTLGQVRMNSICHLLGDGEPEENEGIDDGQFNHPYPLANNLRASEFLYSHVVRLFH